MGVTDDCDDRPYPRTPRSRTPGPSSFPGKVLGSSPMVHRRPFRSWVSHPLTTEVWRGVAVLQEVRVDESKHVYRALEEVRDCRRPVHVLPEVRCHQVPPRPLVVPPPEEQTRSQWTTHGPVQIHLPRWTTVGQFGHPPNKDFSPRSSLW